MYSYTVITHVHFVDLDILIRLDVDFATLQRFFNYSILARLEDFVDLDILINLIFFRFQHFAALGMFCRQTFHYT